MKSTLSFVILASCSSSQIELPESFHRLKDWHPKFPRLPAAPRLLRQRKGSLAETSDAEEVVRDATSCDNSWSLSVQRDGVRVWRRTVPGSPYNEVRANGILQASPREVLALLRRSDEDSIRLYNPMYDSGRDLEQLDANTKVSYGAVRAIFPFKPRDTVTCVAFRELPDGVLALILNAVDHPAMPPRSGYVRAKIITGTFIMEPVRRQPGKTNFTMSQQVNAGGIIPAWCMNSLMAQDAVQFVKRLDVASRQGGRTALREPSTVH